VNGVERSLNDEGEIGKSEGEKEEAPMLGGTLVRGGR